jgi:hypothetical protein
LKYWEYTTISLSLGAILLIAAAVVASDLSKVFNIQSTNDQAFGAYNNCRGCRNGFEPSLGLKGEGEASSC